MRCCAGEGAAFAAPEATKTPACHRHTRPDPITSTPHSLLVTSSISLDSLWLATLLCTWATGRTGLLDCVGKLRSGRKSPGTPLPDSFNTISFHILSVVTVANDCAPLRPASCTTCSTRWTTMSSPTPPNAHFLAAPSHTIDFNSPRGQTDRVVAWGSFAQGLANAGTTTNLPPWPRQKWKSRGIARSLP